MHNIREAAWLSMLLLLLYAPHVQAFDDGDFQTWNTVDISYKINEAWKVTGEEELRWADDWKDFCYTHTEIGIVYGGLAKWLDLGVNYRQIFEEKGRDFQYENRPHANVTLKTDIEGWSISDRSRIEYRDKETGNDSWEYRNKLTVKAPLKVTRFEIRPFVADEIFYNFDEEDFVRNRLQGGIGFKLIEHVGGEIFYLWQTSDSSSGDWIDYHVLGSKLKFSF